VYGDDANGAKILGFPVTFYMFRDVGPAPSPALAHSVPCSLYAVYELAFALLCPTIVLVDIIGTVFACYDFTVPWL
jgi:hypothetical protein